MSIESRLTHPCFPQPNDPAVSVWRYMDLSKLAWLLTKKKLYFSRLDQLQDPFEGSSTRRTLDGIKQFLERSGHQKAWENILNVFRQSRTQMFVNCWYAGNEESEAMWRLYCSGDHGVAIQTTYNTLIESIRNNENVSIGRVTYVDYEKHHFPDSNLFYPVMHKRLAFAHESEVRLVQSNHLPEGEERLLHSFV